MIRIGTVWDRTTDVLAGRSGILAGIALLLVFLPSVVQAAVRTFGGANVAIALIAGIVGIAVAVLAVWASLSLTAVASDPAVDRDRALAIGRNRLPAGLAVLVVLMLIALVAVLPGIALLASSGFDFARARAGLPQLTADTGRAGGAMLYFLALSLAGIWFSARLVPLFAIVTNERRGLRALSRSFALTRGSTLKLIGVMILYAIVLFVVLLAATSIVGLIFRLALGPESTATVGFVVAVVGAAVTSMFSVLQSTFSAQFYIAAVAARDGAAPEA